MQSIFLDVGIINCLARTPSDFYTAYFVEQKSGLRPSDKFGSTGIVNISAVPKYPKCI